MQRKFAKRFGLVAYSLMRMGDKLGSLTMLVDGVLYSVEVFAKALNIDLRYREGSTLVTRAQEYWSCKEDVSEFLSLKQKQFSLAKIAWL